MELQKFKNDCGVSCVHYIVLQKNNRYLDYYKLLEAMELTERGISVQNICEILKDYKLDSFFVRISLTELQNLAGIYVVLHISHGHYLVVVRAERDQILYYEPTIGELLEPILPFMEKYSLNAETMGAIIIS